MNERERIAQLEKVLVQFLNPVKEYHFTWWCGR